MSKMENKDDWIYDVEVLPNVFTCTALSKNTGDIKRFEISPRKNDIKKFSAWLTMLKLKECRMVGFNNIHYDYPILHYLLTVLKDDRNAKQITKNLYNKSQAIFKDSKYPTTKFKHTIWDSDHLISQVDLFKIHHFDNRARATSLKRLQFNMRLQTIKEFEVDFNQPIKKASILKDLVKYNDHDVISTAQFMELSKPHITFRETLKEKFGKSFMNDNDTKIGEKYLVDELKDRVGYETLYIKDESGKSTKRITRRDVIKASDVLFDYIKFEHPALKTVLNQMKGLNIFVIKGKFKWNENDDYKEGQERIVELKNKIKNTPKDQRSELKERLEHLEDFYADHHITANMDGFIFEFGKGGLHGTLRNTIRHTTKERLIIDIDATSFYPKLGIENGLYPEHLGHVFCQIYSNVFDMRKSYAKGTPENAMLKLALNGTYGKTNSEYSVFCDPQYTISTTLNGQLLLCMLWEWLSKIPGTTLIQANTDGITIEIDKKKSTKQAVKRVCRRWEKLTRIPLESAVYKRMWIRDGNNYIAEYLDGKLKQKGAYMYQNLFHNTNMDTSNVEWHKNHSMMVVQKAVESELVHGISADKFIVEHDDVYDFFLCTNVNRSSRLYVGDGIIPAVKKSGKTISYPRLGLVNEEIQRNSRYIISNSDRVLTKEMNPLKGQSHMRYIGINVDYNVTVYNEVVSENINDYDINYQFYINEANKLLAPFKEDESI